MELIVTLIDAPLPLITRRKVLPSLGKESDVATATGAGVVPVTATERTTYVAIDLPA